MTGLLRQALTPACCLTSATGSLVGLLLIGAVEPQHVLLHWFSWWAGDTFGALAMLPLLLLASGDPAKAKSRSSAQA